VRSILFLPDGYFWGMVAWLVAGVVALYLLILLRGASSSTRSRRVAHCGLSLWMLLTTLTAVELYFAVFYDTTDSFSMTNVSKKWFAMHVKPHERELRFSRQLGILYRDDHAVPRELPAGRRHIVFVGDSFTYGHGVRQTEDRFSNRLARSLDPERYTVTNLSNLGIDLDWIQRLLVELFHDDYPVDTLVYVVCLNDIETCHPRFQTYYQDLGKHAPSFFLFRDTYFFNLVYFRTRQFTVPDIKDYYSFVREYYDGRPWQLMQGRLDTLDELCRAHGAELQLVIFPFLHNLGPDYPFRHVHGQFAEYAETRKIKVLDLAPALEPHVAEGLTVNRFDAHPNERAHRLAAEAIRAEWFENGK